MESGEQLRVGDWCLLGEKYFDVEAGELVEIFAIHPSEGHYQSGAFRPVLRKSDYSKTGYFFPIHLKSPAYGLKVIYRAT